MVGACRSYGSLVLSGLGHIGGRPAAPDAGRLRLIRDHYDVAALTAVSTD